MSNRGGGHCALGYLLCATRGVLTLTLILNARMTVRGSDPDPNPNSEDDFSVVVEPSCTDLFNCFLLGSHSVK